MIWHKIWKKKFQKILDEDDWPRVSTNPVNTIFTFFLIGTTLKQLPHLGNSEIIDFGGYKSDENLAASKSESVDIRSLFYYGHQRSVILSILLGNYYETLQIVFFKKKENWFRFWKNIKSNNNLASKSESTDLCSWTSMTFWFILAVGDY